MKFAHLSDAHLGGWRDPKLRDVNAQSFVLAINKCIESSVDFVLISGDLFNTAVTDIESVKLATRELKRLKDAEIPVYYIAGSHDFSPSGKTMLDVLEHAGLAVNVAKGEELPDNRIKLNFTIDKKTGAKITGMIGKKGGLETNYYELLARDLLESELGFKIFLFHTALSELKPKELSDMDSMGVSMLPKGFDYYAGGHVHVVDRQSIAERKNIVYPGPVFPNNFAELEKLKQGSFVLFDNGLISHVPLVIHPVVSLVIDADNKSASDVESDIKKALDSVSKNSIVLIRVAGMLRLGRPADVDWNSLFGIANDKGAFVVLRNTNKFLSKEMEVVSVSQNNVEDVESAVLREHAGQFKLSDNDLLLAKKLIVALSAEKQDGERVADFEARLHSDLDQLLK